MDKQDLLDGKRILIVDDEPDVLDTLEDLLTMCRTTKAATFEQAKALLEDQYFDMAILDIMGVQGDEISISIQNPPAQLAMKPREYFDVQIRWCKVLQGPAYQVGYGAKIILTIL